ncbi:MAG: Flp pilus assembly protein CpaB [Burkholderiaceae bacterium]
MKPIDWWRRFRVPLLWAGALGFGLLGASAARSYIAGELDAARQRADMSGQLIEVVVAKRNLVPGARIDAESMAVRRVAASYLPAGAVTPAEFPAFEGENLGLGMGAGEPLFAAAVAVRERAGLSSRIPPGTRAMTVVVDEVNSVSGMLRPGDRIDLMFSVRPRPDAGLPVGEVATPLMSNLLVLATGTRTQIEPPSDAMGRFGAITVEVTPEQAQRLILAQRSGRITALLRHPDDRSPAAREALDLDALLGIARRGRPDSPEMIVGGRGPIAAPAMPLPEASLSPPEHPAANRILADGSAS